MYKVEELTELVNREIDKLSFDKTPKELYEPIAYTMSQGGKRLRPILSLLACEMFGGDVQKALVPAMSLEMFHNFTLIHDDIMDKAPIRRGVETVYKKWNQNIAILSGDALFSLAYEKLLACDIEHLVDFIHLLNETAVGVCEGQQLDLNFESQKEVSIDEYIEMIRLKTAILIGACLKAGAIAANADKKHQDMIYEYGVFVGLAFQLMDDLLDVYADIEKFGKKPGGDIRENKKTYLYLKTLEVASKEDAELLRNYFSSTDIEDDIKYDSVRAIFDKYNIKALTEEKMNSYYEKALSILDQISYNHTEILRISKMIINRDH
ncbi:MAG: polyprenyl synthetase family protein [Bacteroidales bacterium]|nr:polyprenyl synthetase family protein [Bacteroidales bacterium]MDY0215722.1 polyprenyl synthetase family protein [Bacteroidales bacterium]